MADPIITDEEKDALIDGVETGEVEILANTGPAYADVNNFEIAARSRLVSNSFPRLQRLNRRVASRLEKLTEQLLGAETEIHSIGLESCKYGEFSELYPGLSLTVEFAAPPLEHSGLLALSPELVAHIVEAFYGGDADEPTQHSQEFMTRGEIGVASLFAEKVLETLSDVWQPLMQVEHEALTTHPNTDLIEGFEASDVVISATFDIEFLGQKQPFHIVWPKHMIAPLIPVFEGQKRERDAAQDARWEKSLRTRLLDAVVNISSRLGKTRMTLGNVAALDVGDVIDIEDPRLLTMTINQTPILNGNFGVHDGKYAVETLAWPDSAARSASGASTTTTME
ncbi:MAG: FliM/FliN family flagellar motor switch protein [Pseudomonadota bacterium]